MKIRAKIFMLLMVAICLIGCQKNNKPKDEYIPLFEDGDKTFYVATPSGVIVYSTDSNTYYSYEKEDGTIVTINDYLN